MKYCLFLLMLLPVVGNGQIITTIAGNNTAGYAGDGLQATSAELHHPIFICQDKAGNILFADCGNNVIRKINTDGVITTIAGNRTAGYTGDGGPATAALLSAPIGITIDDSENLYFCELYNHVIRKINSAGIISTIGGRHVAGYSGDGGPATNAMLDEPYGITVDAVDNIYFTDALNYVVRKIDIAGNISTIAGNNTMGYSGDGFPATNAQFGYMGGIAVSNSGAIYIADYVNHRIRILSEDGIINTYAGTGVIGNNGDGLQATSADLNGPNEVYVDNNTGEVYITDSYADVLRKVNTSGIITTIAGNGTAGYSGDGGPATAAQLGDPAGILINAAGNIFIAEYDNNTIRKVTYHPEAVNNVFEPLNLIGIFPNPTQNELTIKSGTEIKSVQVINILGMVQALPMPVLNQKEVVISVGTLPPGMYYVKVNESQMGKFVKE